jgi:predicted MPP superfamily phosphohydrolase
VSFCDSSTAAAAQENKLAESLRPRLRVEEYFARSGRTFRKSRFRLWFNLRIKTAVFKFIFKLLGIYSRGIRNALSPRVSHVQLYFEDLPQAFDGFEILHLSDFHIDKMDGLMEVLAPVLANLRPDLCVMTGDYRYEINGPYDEVYPRMSGVLSKIHARLGTLGILGNHDAAEMAFWFERMGVRMLINDSVAIREEDSCLWFAGVDDQFDYRCADMPKAVSAIPAAGFKILLAHSPQMYGEASELGVRLYLCGHTHAGQVRLPVLGAVKKNAPVPRPFVQGHWTFGEMQGYTSWGAGCSTLPVRYRCPPEVALLQLRRGKAPAVKREKRIFSSP